MGLIKCPECGKEISDQSTVCIGCGFPIREYIEKQKMVEEEERKKKEEEEKLKPFYWCKCCNRQNEIGDDYCAFCGNRLTPYVVRRRQVETNVIQQGNQPQNIQPISQKEFNGVYRYTLFGEKKEVYCPRCKSPNCSHYQEQKVIPGKTKTRYTANLNPLHPFTLVNKKEKVKREEKTVTENKFICNSCGKIFY